MIWLEFAIFTRESHESRQKSQLQQIESKKFASIRVFRGPASEGKG
jgi:hypothetical protein